MTPDQPSTHAQRMARARLTLSDPPPARTHAERMAAARGIHLTAGDNLRNRGADRRRIVNHRENSDA